MRFFESLAEGLLEEDAFRDAFGVEIGQFEGEANDRPEDKGFRRYVMEARIGRLTDENPRAMPAAGPPRTPPGWFVNLAGFSLDRNQTFIEAFFYSSRNCEGMPCGPSLIPIPVNYDSIWADVKDRPVRLMSEAETHFHRGNLMLHVDRLDEADGFLQLAMSLDSRLANAQAAMGHLRSKQARYVEAQELLKRAVSLAPNDYLPHYYSALNLSKESAGNLTPEKLDSIAADLKRTVELAPQFVEASQWLAEINVKRKRDLDDTVDLVRDAIKQSPGRETLVLTLARALAAAGETRAAERTLNRIDASPTAESFMKQAVAELRDSVRGMPEERGAVQEFFATAPVEDQKSVEVRSSIPDDPVGVLVPINPPQLPAGEVIRGRLTALDCTRGLTVVLEAADRTVRLHTNTPDKIEFLRHTETVSTKIACGAFAKVPISVTYRPGTSAEMLGEPIRVEFLEAEREK
jgi:tetratricopeptide (TPR) repeat protein